MTYQSDESKQHCRTVGKLIQGDLTNGRFIALFALLGVLLITFLAIQFWDDDATVPPGVLKQRTIILGS